MPSVSERAFSILRESHLLRGLERHQLEGISEKGAVTMLAPGERIAEDGQPIVDLFVVLTGEVEVFLPETVSRFSRVHLATVGPGKCIGEYSFVDGKAASATVAATRVTDVFCISQKDFRTLLEEDPALARIVTANLLGILIARLRDQNIRLDLFRPN